MQRFKELTLALLMTIVGAPVGARDIGWPVDFLTDDWTITIYQPQVDGIRGAEFRGRAAVTMTGTEVGGVVHGAMWLTARLDVDRAKRSVRLAEPALVDLRFADASDEQRIALRALLDEQIGTWELELALDRLLAAVELPEGVESVDGLRHEPPLIVFAERPAVLVSVNGEPEIRPVEVMRETSSKIQQVVNTVFPLFYETGTRSYYLYGGTNLWYAAQSLEGPWRVTKAAPVTVKRTIPEEERDAPRTGDTRGRPPEIIVTFEASELVVSAGPPTWESIEGTGLQYMANTDSYVFNDSVSQQYFLLISGRWYRGDALSGPWQYVEPSELPRDFADIPPSSAVGSVRYHVAGTPEAGLAVLDAQIPQTAVVRRNATFRANFDDSPIFEPIEGTEMHFAVNSAEQIVRAGDRYYACEQGIWYDASRPDRRWDPSDKIPEEIYSIPAEHPFYNLTYARVYDSTDEAVTVGYTAGYLGSYVHDGTMVYGTGWQYQPWFGETYQPRPSTWGFNARYNPYSGWGFGMGYSTGPFVISVGSWGFGASHAAGWGWFGVGGYRPVERPYPKAGYMRPASYEPRPLPAPKGAGSDNLYARRSNRRRVIRSDDQEESLRPQFEVGRANDLYVGLEGRIWRRNEDGWLRRDGAEWTAADPTAESALPTDENPAPIVGPATLEDEHRSRRLGGEWATKYEKFRPAEADAVSTRNDPRAK